MYNYQEMKPELFTDHGQRDFLLFRDKANELLKLAGAFMLQNASSGICDTDMWLVCADRMVELGEIVELKRGCFAQNRVFVKR